ncbi:hypothetical protein MKW98_020887, partial [Papaver atlanticum]
MLNKTRSNPKQTIFSLILFLPLLFLVVNSLKTQEYEGERSILLKLKKEFGIDSSVLESWISNKSHHCNWK